MCSMASGEGDEVVPMIKQLKIELTERICSCEPQTWSWSIVQDGNSLSKFLWFLCVHCTTCRATCYFPPKDCLATISAPRPPDPVEDMAVKLGYYPLDPTKAS